MKLENGRRNNHGNIFNITLISSVVGGIAYLVNDNSNDNLSDGGSIPGVIGFVLSFIVCSIIPFIIICGSYTTYVDARTKYDATIGQYKEAVTMYADHAKINVDKAFSDFKYQGYQENIAAFIKELRREVTRYNETIISKRVMDKNFFFGWVIIAPDDDMMILSLTKNKETVRTFGEIEERPPVAQTQRPK